MQVDAQENEIRADEAEALIGRMKASKAFSKVKKLRDLLDFLYGERATLRSAEDIEVLHYHFPKHSARHDPGHSRERIARLQKCFQAFRTERPAELVKCELPNAVEAGGYQLKFTRVTVKASATSMFWSPHLDSEKEISVICDPLLFFYEHAGGKLFRFVDTNIEGVSREEALSQLQKSHERDYSEKLVAGHFYVDIGAVTAAELIRDCFWRLGKVRVPLILEKQILNRQWLRDSPILLGTPRTNAAMWRIQKPTGAAGLGFRLHKEKFAWLVITEPKTDEIAALKRVGAEVDEITGIVTTPRPELTLGIVTRIENPSGSGAITFISSDSTFNTAQMAVALTNETQLRRVFAKVGWALDKTVPRTFEMMFFVRLWPGNLDDEGAEAELIAWRSD
jgi:hypothetical protein